LNIKFSQKKQEIREDPVMDFFLNAKQYTVKYRNILASAGIGVAVVVGIVLIFLQSQKMGSNKAQAGFGRAMIEFNSRNMEKAIEEFRAVAEKQPGTASGAESALMLGSIFLTMDKCDEAIQWFVKAEAAGASLGFVCGEAREALANCYEIKGDIPKALDYLDKALSDNQVKYRHPAIRWKMALLNRKVSNVPRAKMLCNEILSDTTAADYRQRAENLLAVLEAVSG
jgi:tetratricopeptide (TPR) repeat protein